MLPHNLQRMAWKYIKLLFFFLMPTSLENACNFLMLLLKIIAYNMVNFPVSLAEKKSTR